MDGASKTATIANGPICLEQARLSQKEALLTLADSASIWRTSEGETFATVFIDGHYEHHSVISRDFRDWLLSELAKKFKIKGRPASANSGSVRDAIATIQARGFSNSARHVAALRVTSHSDSVYIDLGDRDWRSIRVSPDGWDIVGLSPVPITRTRKTAAFPVPIRFGSFDRLRELTSFLSERDFILFLAWLLGALCASGPYPILIIGGEAGSGKSTLARLARRMTDPTSGDLLQPPGNDRDLVANAKQNRVLAFDNLSRLTPDLADSLCRISTGGEIGGRALFTDNESAGFSACRPIILNGIPDLASRGDLASRSIIIHLTSIATRRSEAEMTADLQAAIPSALGGLFTALSCAMKNLDTTKTPNVRMADWARVVCAAEPALPWSSGSFLAALRENSGTSAAASIDSDPVANAVRDYANANEGGWSGLMSELHSLLEKAASPELRLSGDWPRSPKWFSEHLIRAAPALRSIGVHVSTRRTSAGVIVQIARLATFATSIHGEETSLRLLSVANVASSNSQEH
jgi:putative DNA primase/helicase